MKKIGIITLFGLYNYGNLLQNYALYSVLQKNNHTINVRICPKYYFNKYYIKRLTYPFLSPKTRLLERRRALFYNFHNGFVYHENFNNKKNYNTFDYFIVGSDQVWNPQLCNDLMFLPFVSPERRVAYAASFGVSKLPEEVKEKYKRHLSEMKAISVREEAGARIVKELTGRDVPVVIDPTLLLNKEDWEKVASKPTFHIPERYLLTYFLGQLSDDRNQYIEKLAASNGLEIIRLEEMRTNEFWWSTGPSEFIWLIEHCSLMCTDSFHGSVFSIIMEVPFLVFDREDSVENMGSRLETLLDMFKLENRRFHYQTSDKVFQLNYQHIHMILESERDKAMAYLEEALEISKFKAKG